MSCLQQFCNAVRMAWSTLHLPTGWFCSVHGAKVCLLQLLAHSGQRGLSPSPHSTTPTAPSPPLATRSPRRPEHTVIRAQNRARALTQVTGTKSLQRQLLAQIQERHSEMHLHLLRALQADPTTTPPIHMRPGKGATASRGANYAAAPRGRGADDRRRPPRLPTTSAAFQKNGRPGTSTESPLMRTQTPPGPWGLVGG